MNQGSIRRRHSIRRCACPPVVRSRAKRNSGGLFATFQAGASASFPISGPLRLLLRPYCLPGGISSRMVACPSSLIRSTPVIGPCRLRPKRTRCTGYERNAKWTTRCRCVRRGGCADGNYSAASDCCHSCNVGRGADSVGGNRQRRPRTGRADLPPVGRLDSGLNGEGRCGIAQEGASSAGQDAPMTMYASLGGGRPVSGHSHRRG